MLDRATQGDPISKRKKGEQCAVNNDKNQVLTQHMWHLVQTH